MLTVVFRMVMSLSRWGGFADFGVVDMLGMYAARMRAAVGRGLERRNENGCGDFF